MQIKRLRLTGFKSFVDPADLRIEPGLTGVVGPNGCGKSNLLEALRWAMGENSAKSLRGAGMDDVIFAGTATRPRRDFAEVSILADGVGPGPDGDEIEVVRRIERGAGSAYRIDGRDVRARDVGLLFADAATGAHSPALVSQGRIGAVIAARPAERRAMLEEAAGISGLHVRRKDAEQRLRATEVNLARLDAVIADQEARANALRRQARQAERYRALSQQIRVAEGRMIFARWRDAAAAAEAAARDARDAEAIVADRTREVEVATRDHGAVTAALAAIRAAAIDLRDTASAAGHRLATLRTERGDVARRLEEMAANRARLGAELGREDRLARDAADALDRLTSDAAGIEAALADAVARGPAIDAALDVAERAGRDAEVALAQSLAAQASEAADLRVAQAALAAARMRQDRAARDLSRTDAEATALADTGPLMTQRAQAEAARAQAERQAGAAREVLVRAEASERSAIAVRDRAQAQRSGAHAELATLDSEAAALSRATRPADKDRLLDRLRPAPGYERALAAALGDDLEAGLDPASERYWAGADPQPGDPAGPADTTPLAEHVAAPPALARRLAQVRVADADRGQPLAAGQRLVTLDGLLRRWDGYVARSGGAAAAERLIRINRLRAIEDARPAAVRMVESADAELAHIDLAIAQARRDAGEARRALASAETAARDALRSEDRASAALERIANQRADLENRAGRVRADGQEAFAEVERAATAVAALPDGTATRDRVALVAMDADRARAAMATARADRARLDQAIARDRERLAGIQAESRGWRARAGEAANRIGDMTRRADELAQQAAALDDRPATLDTAVAAADAAATAARDAAQAAQVEEHGAEATLRDIEVGLRTASEALALARETRAGAAARAENEELRRTEMGRLSGERFECPPPLLPARAGFDTDAVGSPAGEGANHERLALDRERIGPVNLVADTELAEIDAARATNAREREELGHAVNQLRGSIGTLNREGRQRLLAAFEAVDGHFRRLFTTLFNGGQARLELIDSDDPLEAGLEILAQPPGKKLQSLTLLSGGEQALTAVALIFGLFLTNPAPICVLDEVDAPLDDANIERFCDLLDAMTRATATRYLIVTHNAATMRRMHRLFGVTMIEPGVSRLVSVDLGGAETLLAAE